MRFFDEQFPDLTYRMRVLKMFPEEFAKGYVLYKQGKLQPDFQGDIGSWYLLTPGSVVKFNIAASDTPLFVDAIPDILDLDAAQELDRRGQMQKLLKNYCQKLIKMATYLWRRWSKIFNNSSDLAMLLEWLLTFTDVDSIDLSDRTSANATDDLERSV